MLTIGRLWQDTPHSNGLRVLLGMAVWERAAIRAYAFKRLLNLGSENVHKPEPIKALISISVCYVDKRAKECSTIISCWVAEATLTFRRAVEIHCPLRFQE